MLEPDEMFLRSFRGIEPPGSDFRINIQVVAALKADMGIFIDTGFPYRLVGTVCDTRVYSGLIDLQFAGNVLSESLLTPALVTFTRNLAALTPSLLPQWQYLHSATFRIDDQNSILADAWIDHRATDPLIGFCPADATNEVLGNSLIYNGRVLPNGRNFQ